MREQRRRRRPDAAAPDAGALDAAAPDAPGDAAVSGDTLAPGDAGGPDATLTHECPVGAALCLGVASRRVCGDTAAGRRWHDETCGGGAGCLGGACVAGACTDDAAGRCRRWRD